MSRKNYFSHPGLNASKLKLFSGEPFSPKTSVYQLNHQEDEEKVHFKKGSAVHDALEFKGKLPDKYILKEYSTFSSKEAKAWRDDQLSQGKVILKQEDLEAVHNMVKTIWNGCPELIKKAIQSKSACREYELYVDEFKAMLDLYHNGIIYDYKSSRHATEYQIKRDAYLLKYHVQAYHYKKIALMLGFEVKDFFFLVVCSNPPHELIVMRCDDEFMEKGEEEWNNAYERYQKFKDKAYRDLPGYYEEVIDLSIPDYVLESEQINLELNGETFTV